jgi:hypothetical protein
MKSDIMDGSMRTPPITISLMKPKFWRKAQKLHRTGGVRPIGYRSPAWDLSKYTLHLLKKNGFVYDSSCMASDFIAYYPRASDSWGTNEP